MFIRAQLILHVARSNNIDASTEYRLVWCPYVTSGSDEVEYLFAVALGTSVSYNSLTPKSHNYDVEHYSRIVSSNILNGSILDVSNKLSF